MDRQEGNCDTSSRHCRPSRRDAKSVTKQAAPVFLHSSGMVWMGSPLTMKKGILRASSFGCISLSPRSMKPNCLAPATKYSGTCKRAQHPSYAFCSTSTLVLEKAAQWAVDIALTHDQTLWYMQMNGKRPQPPPRTRPTQASLCQA